MEPYGIPLAALIVSLSTLAFSALSLRGKANGDALAVVEHRVVILEDQLEACQRQLKDRQDENIGLLRRLVAQPQP